MNDLGKIVDYLDEYSPYEDIQTLKCVDGLSYSIEKHKCLHLFHCSHCEIQKVIAIQEQTYI
ncbi:hypothetical protein [Pueribacillus sp. YX66]|uniref:hypothetical protein n=1 Tax=Pueribacillus sp. YX66 TaxID=3229242 RepID=UPI00358D69FD